MPDVFVIRFVDGLTIGGGTGGVEEAGRRQKDLVQVGRVRKEVWSTTMSQYHCMGAALMGTTEHRGVM